LGNFKNFKLNHERRHAMKKTTLFLSILLVSLFVCTSAFAQVTQVNVPVSVQASVTGTAAVDVKIFRSTSATAYSTTPEATNTMNFGALIPGDATKPTTSALAGSVHFMAVVTVSNNTGSHYHVQYTGAPLRHTDGTTILDNNAWTVQAGNQIAADGTTIQTVYTAGVNTGKFSAGVTTPYNVYNSNTSGTADAFRVYFGISGDPASAVSPTGTLIPQSQKQGAYSAGVTLSLIP